MYGNYWPADMKSGEGKTCYLMRVLADREQLAAENASLRQTEREQMALGVEKFAEQQRQYIGNPSKNDAASSYCSREALKFADQLRQGASL